MDLFKVTWINYGELDNTSGVFRRIEYDIFSHIIFYETYKGVKDILRCNFSSIFDKLHSIMSSNEFQNEKPYEDGCDGSWYKFAYFLNGAYVSYEGYVYGLAKHEEVVSLIESCAKSTLDDERKILENKCTDKEIQTIMASRRMLQYDSFDSWEDIVTRLEDDSSDCCEDILSEIQLPDGFIKCNKCNSIIHNKYFKNRKYWGKDWFSDEIGDYEIEYDSGECPVCGELSLELPCTGIYSQPDDSDDNSVKEDITSLFGISDKDIDNPFDNRKVYSYNELDYLFKHLSDEDKMKVSDCQFKLDKNQFHDGDSIFYHITVFKDGNDIGRIDMQYHSNTYIDLLDGKPKTTNNTPYYSYEMTLPFNEGKVYSFDELNDLLKHLSYEDRLKVSGCQFKLFESHSYDDTGDIYYDIEIYRGSYEIGKINMRYHSNAYFDLESMDTKTTDDTPHYTYEMTFNNLFDDDDSIFRCKECGEIFCSCIFKCKKCGEIICTCNTSSSRRGSKEKRKNIKNLFDNSKFRCKKCGKIFCTCNTFSSRKG